MTNIIINIPEHYKNNSGIYEIVNNNTKARYIGSACKLLKRAKEHVNKLEKLKHPSHKLQSDYCKDTFSINILILCDIINLKSYEEACLQLIKPGVDYNRTLCASGCLPGSPVSQDRKDHLSSIMKGRKLSEQTKARISISHKNLTNIEFREVNRIKATNATKGVPKSEDHKRKSGLGVHIASLKRKGLLNE